METFKGLMKGLITTAIFTIILFLSAGRLDYYQGWVFLAANTLTTVVNVVTLRKNTDLLIERSKLGEGIKSWDKWLLALSAMVYLIMIIIAGLDSGRFLWTKSFNWFISAIGVAILATGQSIFLTARNQNNFFSSMVRIQKERGHTVCDKGLYKIIRHPGYLGMAVSLFAVPIITTSFWCILPTTIAVILLLIRTSLEDKTLKAELDGYAEYSKHTRYKLIPLIW
ncbi:MAG TPA: isoprenylcysteine carboxylmethyltransferase family protein [Bacteroidales bacterium]